MPLMLHKTPAAVCQVYVPEWPAVLLLSYLPSSPPVNNNHKFNHVRKCMKFHHDFKWCATKWASGSKSKCKVIRKCIETLIETSIISRWLELIISFSASLIRSPLVDTSIFLASSSLLPANASSHVAGKSYKWIIHSDLHVSILTVNTDPWNFVNVNVVFVSLTVSAVLYFIYTHLTWGERAGT